MRSSALLSIAVAIVFGTVAAFLARGLIQPGDSQASRARTIVVAAQPLGFGVALTSDNLREVPWPGDEALEGAFQSVSDLTKDGRRLALANLQRNEPILASKVTGPNQRATLSTQIDEGMRAVSVRVDEVRGVAGFVLPGDRVDVVLTRGETGSQDTAAYADVLLQNAKVLAIDQLANDRQDKPTIARAVTLELGVQQAQKVILAQGVGRLSLILRQSGEAETKPALRVTAGDLGTGEGVTSKDRVAELEKRLEDLTKAAEQSSVRAGEGAMKRIADLEARLRDEQFRGSKPAPMQLAAPTRPDPVVNVIRNGSKRDQYSVITER